MSLDAGQPFGVLGHSLDQLSSLELQHPAQLPGLDLVEKRPDLRERQSQLLQRDDAVEPWKLMSAVPAIAGVRVDGHRRNQPDVLVMAQGPNGHRPETGELSDAEHVHPIVRAFRRGRVKPKCSGATRGATSRPPLVEAPATRG